MQKLLDDKRVENTKKAMKLTQPVSLSDNIVLRLNNTGYLAEPHPIIVNYFYRAGGQVPFPSPSYVNVYCPFLGYIVCLTFKTVPQFLFPVNI